MRAVVGAGLVAVLLAGCGQDLGRANFQRTTVPAAPAVRAATLDANALRAADPCKLVDGAALAEFGQPGEFRASDLNTCVNTVTDAGGKPVNVSLQLGDALVRPDGGGAQLQGLPLIEKPLDNGSCSVSVLTQREPRTYGITTAVTYQGGDACRLGRGLLDKTVRRLRDAPPRYPEVRGALAGRDPCQAVDASVVAQVTGSDKEKAPSSLNSCDWYPRDKQVSVDFDLGVPLSPDSGGAPVDLGGILGFRKATTGSGASCEIRYTQRLLSAGRAEIVRVSYEDRAARPEAVENVCGKAITVAKNVISKLPRP